MQALLFDRASAPHPSALAPTRTEVGPGSWVDHQPGWLSGRSAWFEELRRGLPWREARRPMHECVVAVPRLLHTFHDGGAPASLHRLADELTAHHGRPIRPAHAARHRSGRGSVAMHSDHVGPERKADSVVAILSLGEPRRFHLKPAAGGLLRTWRLGWGDLLVLGGWRPGRRPPRRAQGGLRAATDVDHVPRWAPCRGRRRIGSSASYARPRPHRPAL